MVVFAGGRGAVGALDPLGHHPQSERVAELDRRAHDGLVAPVLTLGAEPGGEHPVDLELADGQVTQVGERREPRAEVVDRDHQAGVGQGPDDLLRPGQVGHDRALRYLEDERVGRQAVSVEHVVDLVGQAVVEEVGGRQVDGNGDRLSLATPGGTLGDGRLEHERGERSHEPALLGQRDELVRRDEPERRVGPAQQGLDRGDRARAQVDLWLVVEHQLGCGDGAAEVLHQVQPVAPDPRMPGGSAGDGHLVDEVGRLVN